VGGGDDPLAGGRLARLGVLGSAVGQMKK